MMICRRTLSVLEGPPSTVAQLRYRRVGLGSLENRRVTPRRHARLVLVEGGSQIGCRIGSTQTMTTTSQAS